MSPLRSLAASAVLLVLLPLTAIAILPLVWIVPDWIAGLLNLVGDIVIAIAVVAYGFRAGLSRRVVAALVVAHVAIAVIGTVALIGESWPEAGSAERAPHGNTSKLRAEAAAHIPPTRP